MGHSMGNQDKKFGFSYFDICNATYIILQTVLMFFSLSAVAANVSGFLSLHLCAPSTYVFVSNMVSVSICLPVSSSVCTYVALSSPCPLSLSPAALPCFRCYS